MTRKDDLDSANENRGPTEDSDGKIHNDDQVSYDADIALGNADDGDHIRGRLRARTQRLPSYGDSVTIGRKQAPKPKAYT